MTRPLRMLALSPVPEEGAGCRFRISQYQPALEAAGFEVTLSPFYTPEFFDLVYQQGQYARKARLFLRRVLDRLRTVITHRTNGHPHDAIYIYREALPIGPPVIETLVSLTPNVAVIYDFDDAIYLPNTSEANRLISALKWPLKVPSIIRRADAMIAGNEYLASYARPYNPYVAVVPTCVDTDKFVPRSHLDLAPPASRFPRVPVIGWIGTPTTAPYLHVLEPILQELARSHRFLFRVCGAGEPVRMPAVRVENIPWTLDQEVALFSGCDIGVYPLTDDEWARGKCGFKAIQFMACGVPLVASALGVNREIISDGVNGFLAVTPADWIDRLGRLLRDASLRASLGRAGRRTIEAHYSLTVNAPKLVGAVHDVIGRVRQRETGPVSHAAP